MKKIIFILLCICMSITTFATPINTYQFDYEDAGITIIFENDSHFTNDERQYIADRIVFGEPDSMNSSTYAWCWLTGHDYQYDSVTAVQHKVSAEAPRCYKTIYKVETCSKCDHMETSVLSSIYFDCCPED